MRAADLPAVGVIIPTRDRLAMVRRALESVWAQEYDGPIDAVVVFDGPVPEDADLPQPRRTDHRLRVFSNPGPRGVVHARTHALAQLDTELVALLDDDDQWLPRRLAVQVPVALARPDVDLVGGGVRVVHDDRVVERPAPMAEATLADLLDDRIMELHPSTFLVRTACLREIGGWPLDLPGGFAEDYELLLRIARRGPMLLVPEIVSTVNWAGNSFFFSRYEPMAGALQIILDRFPEFASRPSGRARVRGQIAFARAALGERRQAWRLIRQTLADDVRQPRAYLAAAVATGLVSGERVEAMAHRRGRGI